MSLQSQAILVSLSLGKLGLSRKEDDERKEVARRTGADIDSFTVTKRLLHGNAAFAAIRQFDAALGAWNRSQTVPWDDDGTRMLPILNFDNYTTYMRGQRSAREALVQTFGDGYDAFVQADRGRLTTMWRAKDYPDKRAILDRFEMKVDMQPVPDARDFRIALSNEDMTRLQGEVDNRLKAAEERARVELFHRLTGPLADMAAKLAEDKVTLRTTNPLIANLKEILDLIPRLNITGDTKIMEFHSRATAQLASISPETLKSNDLVRTVAVRQAEQILADMSEFMGGPAASLTVAA